MMTRQLIIRIVLRYWWPFATSAPLSWMDAGSRGTTAHAHQCCIFHASYAKTVPSRMKLTMPEPANHDNGQGVTASDVILQQRIITTR